MIHKFAAILAVIFLIRCSTNVVDGGSGSEAGNAYTISLSILDEFGNPVDSAVVYLHARIDTRSARDSILVIDSTVVGSDGRYVLDTDSQGEYWISVFIGGQSFAFIDSIDMRSLDTLQILYQKKEFGAISGEIAKKDTSVGQTDTILIYIQQLMLAEYAYSGETFLLPRIPPGSYNIEFIPIQDSSGYAVLEVDVTEGDTTNLGIVTVNYYNTADSSIEYVDSANSTYLLESNVHDDSLKGLSGIPVDIEPTFTFHQAPLEAKAWLFPAKDSSSSGFNTTTVIQGTKVILKHELDFPPNTLIGGWLRARFADNTAFRWIYFDFLEDTTKCFRTEN